MTDTAIKRAPRKDKPYRLKDGRSLHLLVNPNGSKWWRFSYSFAGKRNTLSLGVYPEIGLSDARLRRDDARRFIAQGIDPAAQRKADRTASTERSTNSFEVVAREWLGVKAHEWVPAHLGKETLRLEKHAFPWIGDKPVPELGIDDVLPVDESPLIRPPRPVFVSWARLPLLLLCIKIGTLSPWTRYL